MKTLKEFLSEVKVKVPKPFKIEGLTFTAHDNYTYSFTVGDYTFKSADGQWQIIPGGYREGVGAAALNLTKDGKPSTKLTWSVWSEHAKRLIHTFASLPKAKAGVAEMIRRDNT